MFRRAGDAIWAGTDNLTKWIQVIALCVAAGWTFMNYSVADKPSLEPNVSLDGRFSVENGWEPGTCIAKYTLTVWNQGKVSFDVDEIHFRAWHLDTPKAEQHEATFVDSEHLDQGEKIVDSLISKSPLLLKHYSPGQQSHQDFTWILRRQKTGLTNFTVEVSARSGKRRANGYSQAFGDNICLGDTTPQVKPEQGME
ncbi:MAG: hypothetical protein ABSA78_05590 [Candidatus Sulfotelmatobacter sp.]